MSKYKAKKVELDGHTFDSKKEAKRYTELKQMEESGGIERLSLQVPFELLPVQQTRTGANYRAVKYIADFVYYKDGKMVVEDVKGMKKGQAYQLFVLKKKMLKWFFDIEVVEI